MSDEIKEILGLLNFNRNTISNGICRVEDFMSREQIIKLLDYITNLQKENENLKDFNNKLQATKDRLDKYDRENQLEIERLNNIIDELEKWLEDVDVFQKNFIENKNHITPYRAVLDKLKELKENNNE